MANICHTISTKPLATRRPPLGHLDDFSCSHLLPSAYRLPPPPDLLVKLSGLENANEHEDEAAPRTENLDAPANDLRRHTEVPRYDDEYHHGLDVHHDRGEKYVEGRPVHLPAGAASPLLASPVCELCEVKHDSHHNCNLEPVGEIDESSACATAHKARANIQDGSDENRPASYAQEGGKCKHQRTDGSNELAEG